MTLTIESTRFGEIEIDPASVIEFPDGLIGLGGTRYTLIANKPGSPFLWLQSVDVPATALPVTNPHTFFSDFSLELSDDDADRLELSAEVTADVYVTVTVAAAVEEITVNLKAPLLIHDGHGHQVINQAAGAEIRVPLMQRAVGG